MAEHVVKILVTWLLLIGVVSLVYARDRDRFKTKKRVIFDLDFTNVKRRDLRAGAERKFTLANGCIAVFRSVFHAVLPGLTVAKVGLFEDHSTVIRCEGKCGKKKCALRTAVKDLLAAVTSRTHAQDIWAIMGQQYEQTKRGTATVYTFTFKAKYGKTCGC